MERSIRIANVTRRRSHPPSFNGGLLFLFLLFHSAQSLGDVLGVIFDFPIGVQLGRV